MNQTLKRYLISSLDTFFAGFLAGVVPIVEVGKVYDVETLQAVVFAALASGFLAGVRACIKAAREALLTP
ncbi:hypothetical protein KBA63_00010 [Candidatus Woesebacteria bacterium]|nr:hypothetical protein [Candidatus Woesebacteria bacterium]